MKLTEHSDDDKKMRVREQSRKWRDKDRDNTRRLGRENKRAWMSIPENRIKHCIMQASRRAKEKCIEFDITIDDFLPLPVICPVLGIKLNYLGTGKNVAGGFVHNSPSIDRIDSSVGYIKGNVMIISLRANRIKSDATLKEIKLIAKYMRKFCHVD